MKDLVGSLNKDRRSMLRKEDFIQSIDEATSEVRESFQSQIEILKVEAEYYCDRFWQMKEIMREDEPGLLGTRVIKNGNSFSMVWYKNTFPKQPHKKSTEPFSKHLFKEKGSTKYDMARFSFCNVWEKEMVKFIEPNYSRIRVEVDTINQIKKSITSFSANRKRKLIYSMSKHEF